MKISRNSKCPCGSGLKYKKCCLIKSKLPTNDEIMFVKSKMEEELRRRTLFFESRGIFINFVTPINFKGKKVFALGSTVYHSQPPNTSFHDFIIWRLQQELGEKWWREQETLPLNDSHFVYQCYQHFVAWCNKNQLEENRFGNLWGAKPDGWSKSLLALAFDVCSLIHAVHVPEQFMDKLRKKDSYQGVRYEIAISAIFARLGYKIEFLDETYSGDKNQPRHCEFIARDPKTGEEIAVEVKSKERGGILHQNGTFDLETEFKSSVNKLFRHAVTQNPGGRPFIIFIDMNLPVSGDVSPNDNIWIRAVTQMRNRAKFATSKAKESFNYVIFTNFSYHYEENHDASSGEFLLERVGNPNFLITDSNFNHKLLLGLQHYGKVPNLDELKPIDSEEQDSFELKE